MPGTPIAKSHSLSSVNCLTCLGFISCSPSVFRSSGLSAANSSACRSPLMRTVGGRPTFRCKSEAFIWTSCWSTTLKSNVGPEAVIVPLLGRVVVGLGIWIDPEEDLPVFDGLRVLGEDLLHHARVFRLDLVHDLHCFDDAERLAFLYAFADGHIGLGSGLRRTVERSYHRRLDFQHRRHAIRAFG